MSHAEFFGMIKARSEEQALTMLQRAPALGEASGDFNPLMQALYHRLPALADAIAACRSRLDLFEAAALGRLDALEAAVRSDSLWQLRFASDGFSALHLACFFAHEEAVNWLLARGADPDAVARNRSRVRPLHSAAAAGSTPICRLLLDKGADPDAAQHKGFTALHSAALHGNEPLVELLLEAGADPHRAAGNQDAAAFARSRGHEDLATRIERC